jgi:hypothetical protein
MSKKQRALVLLRLNGLTERQLAREKHRRKLHGKPRRVDSDPNGLPKWSPLYMRQRGR